MARKLLKSARERRRSGRILLDGAHLIASYAERFGLTGAVVFVNSVNLATTEISEITASMPEQARVLEVPDALFGDISPVDTPTGIIALVDRPELRSSDDRNPFCLALDNIQDPGNLGSVLRTAAAMQVDTVLLSSSCADPWSPKCLRGGMGAQFALPVSEHVDLAELLATFQGLRIATTSHSGKSLIESDLSAPLVVMIGGEGAGLSPELMGCSDQAVRIPLENGVESLNVGAAVAMICYEHLRQSVA